MKQILFLCFLLVSPVCMAQTGDSVFVYRRGSICSIMIGHRTLQFEQDIEEAFKQMPVPDKYNDHNLGKKVFYTTDKKIKLEDVDKHQGFRIDASADEKKMNDFDVLMRNQSFASRLVAKWFNRDKNTGRCNMQLVQDRGYQNASEVDKRMAKYSVRKEALLMDAGEELIGSTFVLVNDIRYIDRSRGSSVIGGVVSAASKVAMIASGTPGDINTPDLGTLIASYKGFNVKIKTYLYQLVWDEEAQSLFYQNGYSEEAAPEKKSWFENNRGKFSLIYLGMQESSGKTVSFAGIGENNPKLMVRKACQRALDENVANLQKNFESFKIKAPLTGVEPITAEIGLKEGITADSRFEVLEVIETEGKHVEYKRIGVIKPVKNKIWDNRFMAEEEKADNATLGYTTFERVSGSDLYLGCLIRELK